MFAATRRFIERHWASLKVVRRKLANLFFDGILRVLLLSLVGISVALAVTVSAAPNLSPGSFETLALYDTAVLLLPVIAFLMVWIGSFVHRRIGRYVFSRVWSLGAVTAIHGVFVFLAIKFSADWPLSWAFAAFCFAFATASLCAVGLLAYGQYWRIGLMNSDVVNQVRQALPRVKAAEHGNNPALHGISPLPKKPPLLASRWHSRHCLLVVQTHYEAAKQDLLQALGASRRKPSALISAQWRRLLAAFQDSGTELLHYLDRGIWHHEELEDAMRVQCMEEVARELIAVTLWFSQPHAGIHPIPVDWNRLDEGWRGAMISGSRADLQFMDLLIDQERARCGRTGTAATLAEDAARSQQGIVAVCHQYDFVLHQQKSAPIPNTARYSIALWVALSGAFRRQSRIDVLMELADRFLHGSGGGQVSELWDMKNVGFETDDRGAWPAFFTPDKEDARAGMRRDAAAVLEAATLDELYGEWAQELPKDAASGSYEAAIRGRANYFATRLSALCIPAPEMTPALNALSSDTPSWTYPYVWRAPRVWAALVALNLLLAASAGVAVWSACPQLPFRPNWNTVEHVDDLRNSRLTSFIPVFPPGPDYCRNGPFKQLAPNGGHVLFGEPTGVNAMNVDSRVMVENITKMQPKSLAALPGTPHTLVLQIDGSIVRLTEMGSRDFKVTPWLPVPPQPIWPNAPPAMPVVACDLDADGALIAVRGTGIARYGIERGADGSTYMTGNWQLSALSGVDLVTASIVRNGVWLAYAEKDGTDTFEFATRKGLDPDPARRRNVPKVKLLSADHASGAGTVIDRNDGLWLFSSLGGAWRGPYFSKRPASEPRLQSASDVTVACLDGTVAWLGGAGGVWADDTNCRSIMNVIASSKGGALGLLPMPRDKSEDGSRLIAGGGFGVAECSCIQGSFSAHSVDDRKICALGMDPQGRLGVYQVDASSEVRAFSPFVKFTGVSVIPAKGWSCETEPSINAIKPAGAQFLMTTDGQGAFLHDPGRHSYTDFSTLKFKDRPELAIRSYSDVVCDSEGAAALGDGRALVASPSMLKSGTPYWTGLDPEGVCGPLIRLARSHTPNDVAFAGLKPDGGLARFNALEQSGVKLYCRGRAGKLPNGAGEVDVCGDLAGNRISLLMQNTLCRYDISIASYDELPVPAGVTGPIAHYKMGEKVDYFVNGSGTAFDCPEPVPGAKEAPIVQLFSIGTLPVLPSETTAVAPGLNGTVLTAGKGVVGRYDWASAAHQEVGATFGAGHSPVDFLAERRFGVLAHHANGQARFCAQFRWEDMTGYASVSLSDDAMWSVSVNERNADRPGGGASNSVCKMQAVTGQALATWPKQWMGPGAGMRAFAASAQHAWKLSDSRVALFSRQDKVGVYDIATDAFEIKTAPAEGLEWLAASAEAAVFRDGQVIRKMDRSEAWSELTTLGADYRNVSARLNAGEFALAFVEQGNAALRRWPKLDPKVESVVRKSELSGSFNIRQVIYAGKSKALRDSQVFLIDRSGSWAAYDWLRGEWSLIRKALPGQTVTHCVPHSDGAGVDLILEHTGATSGLERLCVRDGAVADRRLLPGSLDGIRSENDAVRAMAAVGSLAAMLATPAEWNCVMALRMEAVQWRELPAAGLDGKCFDNGSFSVIRKDGVTGYAMEDNGAPRVFAVRPNGFDEDRVRGVSFDAEGNVWALLAYRMVKLTAQDLKSTGTVYRIAEKDGALKTLRFGQLQVVSATGNVTLEADSASGSLHAVARKHMDEELARFHLPDLGKSGGLDMVWRKLADERIDVSWNSQDEAWAKKLPLWSACGDGRLASQFVYCLEVADDGRSLAVSTELGLLMRDEKTYALQEIQPELARVALRSAYARAPAPRVFALAADGSCSHERREKRWVPLTADERHPVSEAAAGPWIWRAGMDPAKPDASVCDETGRPRSFSRIAGETSGWKFNDDIVNWLVIDPNARDGVVWTATRDGIWPLSAGTWQRRAPGVSLGADVRRVRCYETGDWTWMDAGGEWHILQWPGRHAGEPRGDPARADAEVEWNSPVLSASRLDGRIRLKAFDGKAVFENGRFFFDSASGLCGTSSGFCALIAKRCVLSRDRAALNKIAAVWNLPPTGSTPDDAMLTPFISEQDDRVRIEMRARDAMPVRAWKLDVAAGEAARWMAAELNADAPEAQMAPIVWLPLDARRNRFQPALVSDPKRPLRKWWADDRFSWEKSVSAAVLDAERIVLATCAGPVVMRRSGTDFPLETLWPHIEVTRAGVARKGGTIAGVAVYGNAEYLIGMDQGRPVITANTAARSLFSRVQLEIAIDRSNSETVAQRIVIKDSWVPESQRVLFEALISGLKALPSSELLLDGQFIFDRASVACELNPALGQWITAASLSGPRPALHHRCAGTRSAPEGKIWCSTIS